MHKRLAVASVGVILVAFLAACRPPPPPPPPPGPMTLGWTQSGITGPIAADASENLVWAMGGGTLYGLNASTGAIVAQHAVARDGAQHFPTPEVVPDWVVVESQNHVAGFTTPQSTVQPAVSWVSPALDGIVQARPLVVGNIVVVATENDSLYGLNLATGTIAWGPPTVPATHFGTPAPLSEVRQYAGVGACGDIDPLGATSNPALSSDGTTVFAVGERETGAVTPHPPEHVLVGVNPNNGAIALTPKNIDVPAMAGADGHGVARHQQRAGLVVGNNNVYIGFGGLVGDCGEYHGVVVAASQATGTVVGSFEAAAASNAAAVWGTSGPIVDGSGNVYATTGNSFNAPASTDYSDAVVKLASNMPAGSIAPADYFQPAAWRADNNADLDLGSTGPVFASSTQLFVIGKQHDAFLLNLSSLGGADHNTPVGTINACPGVAMGQNAVLGSSAYVACSNGIRQVHLG